EPGAMALDHAHKQGVVHRDVKPGNLFLAASRMYGVRMKVLDFGLAKIMDETIGITLAATVGNYMMCSPRYAAPEQFDPKICPIGPWTDVYSLAIVMLEAMRDVRVRGGDGIVACMSEAIDPKVNISPPALGLQLPRGVEVALSRAVSIDMRQRQKSAGEFWGEIKAGMQAGGSLRPAPAFETTVAMAPASRAPVSAASDTLVDPVYSAPLTGLGGTLFMENSPVRPSVPQASPAAGRSSSSPSHLPPGYVPISQYGSRPPPHAQASHPQQGPPVQVIAPAQRPAPAPRASRTPLVVFLLLLVLAGSGVAGFFGWRWWVARHAAAALASPQPGG
ncbi:MAG TPA: protein kinase, partial [Polyangiaceae bacterium]